MIKVLAVLILTFSLFFVVNCGSTKIPKDFTDEQLYDAAMKELTEAKGGFPWIFRGRDYDMVFAYLKEIQLRYTYSPYATLAELRTGDAYFQKGEYEQGIFFTTSDFTKGAMDASIKKGAVPIVLLNGESIVSLMIEKEFGVQKKPLQIYDDQLESILGEALQP